MNLEATRITTFTVIDWLFVVKRQVNNISAVFMTRNCVNVTTDFLLTESSIDNWLINPLTTTTKITKEEITVSYKIVLCSFGISIKDEDFNIPSLYWIPQMYMTWLIPLHPVGDIGQPQSLSTSFCLGLSSLPLPMLYVWPAALR